MERNVPNHKPHLVRVLGEYLFHEWIKGTATLARGIQKFNDGHRCILGTDDGRMSAHQRIAFGSPFCLVFSLRRASEQDSCRHNTCQNGHAALKKDASVHLYLRFVCSILDGSICSRFWFRLSATNATCPAAASTKPPPEGLPPYPRARPSKELRCRARRTPGRRP